MLIIQINIADTKALEATLTTGSNVFRRTVHYHIIRDHFDDSKLCGNLNLVSRQVPERLRVNQNLMSHYIVDCYLLK